MVQYSVSCDSCMVLPLSKIELIYLGVGVAIGIWLSILVHELARSFS
jgi:hypothetical protein